MAIFYYCKSAKLHLCSKTLGCTEEDYEKLTQTDKEQLCEKIKEKFP